MDMLTRRYERLLRAYPADYRRERGAEMLDTLLASARPGQRRPDLREAGALVFAGARARFGITGRQPAATTLREAVVAAGLLWGGVLAALSLIAAFSSGPLGALSTLLLLAAIALLLAGRPRLASVAMLGIAALIPAAGPSPLGYAHEARTFAVAYGPLLIAAACTRRRDGRRPAAWGVLVAAVAVLVAFVPLGVIPATLLVVLFGLFDPRLMLGLAGPVLWVIGQSLVDGGEMSSAGRTGMTVVAVLAVLPIATGLFGAVRLARR